jgi:hypothetical protein
VLASNRKDILTDFNANFVALGANGVTSVAENPAKAFLYCECPNVLSSVLKTEAATVVKDSGSTCSALALNGYGSIPTLLAGVTVTAKDKAFKVENANNLPSQTNPNAITKDCVKDNNNLVAGERCTELTKKFGQDYHVTREKTPSGSFKDVSEEHVTVDKNGNIQKYTDPSVASQYTTAPDENGDTVALEKHGNKFYKADGSEYKGAYNYTNSDGSTITKNEKGQITKETYDDGTYVEYKDGKPVAYKDSKGNPISQDNKNKTYARRETTGDKKNEREDPCKVSSAMNQGYKCRGTQTAIDISNAQAQVTQLAGAAGLQITGQNAYNQYQQSGKMSDAYKGAEKSFKSAKNAQIVVGVVNTAAFALLNGQKKKHQDNMAAIDGGNCGGRKCTAEELDAIAKQYRIKGTPTDYETTGKATVDALNKQQAQIDGKRF